MGGLNLAEGSCLAIIDRHGPLSLSDVASRENLSAPTITKIVTRLENQGLIERLADPTDRRVSLVAVSKRGPPCSNGSAAVAPPISTASSES